MPCRHPAFPPARGRWRGQKAPPSSEPPLTKTNPSSRPPQKPPKKTTKHNNSTFVDADFLKSAYAGVLELRILSAKGLRGVNRVGGKSDPYCVASLPDDGGRVATPVIWGCLDPVWFDSVEAEAAAKGAAAATAAAGTGSGRKAPSTRSRTHTLYVRRDPAESASDPRAGVRFTVYDRANGLIPGVAVGGGEDVELGTAAVSVADFVAAAGGKPGAWVKKTVLMCGPQATGTLEVEARYLPFSTKRGGSVAFVKDFIADEGPAVPGPAPAEVKAAGADLVAAGKGGKEGEAAAEAAVGDAAGLLAKKPAGPLGRLGGLFGGGGKNKGAAAAAAAEAPAPAPTPAAPAPAAADAAAADAKAAEREMAEAWRAVTKAAGRILHVRGERGSKGNDYRAVAFAQSIATDTEAWIGRSLSAREVVIAFRGTEMGRMKDAISDINAVPVPYADEGGEGEGGATATEGEGGGLATAKRLVAGAASADKVYVHAGFLRAWESVRSLVFSAVAAAITSSGDDTKPWRVLITGHSLGGALATLCTYELANPARLPLPNVKCPVDVAVYTYGAPRVGNVAFALSFHSRIEAAAEAARKRGGDAAARGVGSWRLLNERDLVPTIPRLMGYAHVPYGVRLPADDAAAASALGASDAKAKAAKAVAGVLADERAGASGTAADEAAADRAAASALSELERFLIFEPATGSDALGEGRDAGTLASDAARSARAAFQAKGGFSLGAIGAAATAAAGAVGGGKLVEHEMRIAKALTDGAAIADHMEGVYFGKLVVALTAAGVKLPSAIVDKYAAPAAAAPSGSAGGAAAPKAA
jgi:hypothetical protein